MSFYFISQPDSQNPNRWLYNIGTASSTAILQALRDAGFNAQPVQSTLSVMPFLVEVDISKIGATREDLEKTMQAADPKPRPTPAVKSAPRVRRR